MELVQGQNFGSIQEIQGQTHAGPDQESERWVQGQTQGGSAGSPGDLWRTQDRAKIDQGVGLAKDPRIQPHAGDSRSMLVTRSCSRAT